ncbi:MAG TPA: prolipoprotein diacylglyceryl transferase family protein [Marmoricola sp.]|nr:prolipoprotein diacylglyceryl transferase family protein [Marmoricola sp.]
MSAKSPEGSIPAQSKARETPTGGAKRTPPLQFTSFNCESLQDTGPKSLGLTYWYTAADEGEPYAVSVRFVGRRRDENNPKRTTDTFELVKELSPIYPGTGRAAITVRVNDVPDGRWEVTAVPGKPVPLASQEPRTPQTLTSAPLVAARSAGSMPLANATGEPAFAPIVRVRAPGTRLWAWPSLVSSGAVTALAVQWILAGLAGLTSSTLFLVTAVGCLLGLVGAKIYYQLGHRGDGTGMLTPGMSVQGFVLTSFATIIMGSLLSGLPLMPVLDVSTPSLLAGLAIGRLGCFFGGCCVGRPTGASWGLWSSDRTWGTRRIPVQLFESATAATLSVSSAAVLLGVGSVRHGLVFLGGLSAYVLARQMLFPLRSIPRATRYGRLVVMTITAVLTLVSLVALVTAR